MPPSPREYFGSHPEARQDLGPIESRVMDSLPSTDFLADVEPDAVLESLDSLSEDGRFHVRSVLQHLPPGYILETYGADALAWTVVNAYPHGREMGWGAPVMRGMERLMGIDRRGFEVALSWSRVRQAIEYDNQDVRTADVLFLYKLVDSLTEGGLNEVDLDTHLQASIKAGQHINPERYGLAQLRPEGVQTPPAFAEKWGNEMHHDEKCGLLKYKLTLAAPGSIALMFDGRPTAFVSFGSEREGGVCIYQIQGVRANKYDPEDPIVKIDSVSFGGEGHFDWTAMLVQIVEEIAARNGAHTIIVRSSENNPYVIPGHMSAERGQKVYDETAARLGFEQADDRNWHKPIGASS